MCSSQLGWRQRMARRDAGRLLRRLRRWPGADGLAAAGHYRSHQRRSDEEQDASPRSAGAARQGGEAEVSNYLEIRLVQKVVIRLSDLYSPKGCNKSTEGNAGIDVPNRP